MLLWWFHSHTIHVPRWQREPKRYFGNKWAFSTGTVSNAGNMVEQHRETHGHDWTCSYDFCNRVDCQRFEREKKKKKIQNTHEIKRMLFNQTKQDGTCIFFFFFQESLFSSYVQLYNRKQLNQLIICPNNSWNVKTPKPILSLLWDAPVNFLGNILSKIACRYTMYTRANQHEYSRQIFSFSLPKWVSGFRGSVPRCSIVSTLLHSATFHV